jgi:hypothetical protein
MPHVAGPGPGSPRHGRAKDGRGFPGYAWSAILLTTLNLYSSFNYLVKISSIRPILNKYPILKKKKKFFIKYKKNYFFYLVL